MQPLQIRCEITVPPVVGYQTKGLGTGDGDIKADQKNAMAPTFLTVGANKVKLGDIKLGNVVAGNSMLQFLNAYGATAKVTPEMIGSAAFAKFGAVDAVFIYISDAEAGGYGLPGGWYLPADWDDEGAYPMNNVPLKKGQGFVLEANDAGMTVTYSGAVDPGEEGEIALPYNIYEKNVLGNVTPVDLVLGDFVLGNVSGGATKLMFLNQYGAGANVTEEMIGAAAFAKFGAVDAVFIFITNEEAGGYGLPGGWYLPADWDDEGAYPMNNVKIPAGKAFVIEANDAGMTITLPSALAPKAK